MMSEDKYKYHRLVLSEKQRELNHYLRKGIRVDEQTENIISEINSALDATPAYSNKIVHHCGYIGTATIKELSIYFSKRVGKIVQFPSFLSTTKDVNQFFRSKR